MRFLIFGSGGVGGYFGARLAAAGHDVAFIARGAQRRAMAAKGLRVLSAKGDVLIEAPAVFEDPAEAGPRDVVLLCVKMGDTRAAAEALRPALAEDAAVVSLQNGVEAEDILAEVLGRARVLGGVAYIAAHIAEPGVILHAGEMARVAFGELDGTASPRAQALLAAFRDAGIDAEVPKDIRARIWRKFALLAPLAGATCLGRCPVGRVRDDPALRAKLEAMVAEVVALGRARGIGLEEGSAARVRDQIACLPADMKTSMLHDLEAGRPLELDWLNGAVARLGAAAGVPTPANEAVAAALAPFASGTG
jgi:2-dehydropantoate 2-reductase